MDFRAQRLLHEQQDRRREQADVDVMNRIGDRRRIREDELRGKSERGRQELPEEQARTATDPRDTILPESNRSIL